MWSPVSTDIALRSLGAATPKEAPLRVGVWVLLAWLTACSSEPTKPTQPSTQPAAPSRAPPAGEPPDQLARPGGAQPREKPPTGGVGAQPRGLPAAALGPWWCPP